MKRDRRRTVRGVRRVVLAFTAGLALAACRGGSADGAEPAVAAGPTVAERAPSAAASPAGAQGRCVVFLHGKGGDGATSRPGEGYVRVAPAGNAEGWGGKQWLYFPDARYAELRSIVASALDRAGCSRALLHGFSNGGAAVAKLYCRGESFGDRVVAYVFDDPVPDHGADTCAPPKGAQATLYWTYALGQAEAGFRCADGDWTCEGGSTVGVQRFAQNLGVPITKSVHASHAPYEAPPDYQSF